MKTRRLPFWLLLMALCACGRASPLDLSVWPVVVTPAERPEPPPPGPPACAALHLEAQRVVLAAVEGVYGCAQTLRFMHADGTVVEAGVFGASRATLQHCIYISDVMVGTEAGFILADRDRDGAMLFDRQGTLVVQTADREHLRSELAARQLWGLIDQIDGYRVIGAASHGLVPVEKYPDQGPRFVGWIDPGSHAVTPVVSPIPLGATELSWSGNAFTGIVQGNGAATWVQLFADQSRAVPLPDYRGEPYVNVINRRGGWAWLGSYLADREWRVDERTGAIEALSKAGPPGMTQLEVTSTGFPARLYFQLDDDGGFLDVFRTESSAGLFHSPDGAHDWARIGREFANVATVGGVGRDGTYVVWASTNGNKKTWAPTPEGQLQPSGPGTEVIRLSTGVDLMLPEDTPVSVSRAGLCVASHGALGVSITDMETGTARDVPGLAHSVLVWLDE